MFTVHPDFICGFLNIDVNFHKSAKPVIIGVHAHIEAVSLRNDITRKLGMGRFIYAEDGSFFKLIRDGFRGRILASYQGKTSCAHKGNISNKSHGVLLILSFSSFTPPWNKNQINSKTKNLILD